MQSAEDWVNKHFKKPNEPTKNTKMVYSAVKRDHYATTITRAAKNIDDEALFNTWSKGMIDERLKHLEDVFDKYELQYLSFKCDFQGATTEESAKIDEESEKIEVMYAFKSETTRPIHFTEHTNARKPADATSTGRGTNHGLQCARHVGKIQW